MRISPGSEMTIFRVTLDESIMSIDSVFMWLCHMDNIEAKKSSMRNDMNVLINTTLDGEKFTIWLLVAGLLVAAILPRVKICRCNNMPKVSALLALCEGNSSVTSVFPLQNRRQAIDQTSVKLESQNKTSIGGKAFKNVFCEVAVILSRRQWVKRELPSTARTVVSSVTLAHVVSGTRLSVYPLAMVVSTTSTDTWK